MRPITLLGRNFFRLNTPNIDYDVIRCDFGLPGDTRVRSHSLIGLLCAEGTELAQPPSYIKDDIDFIKIKAKDATVSAPREPKAPSTTSPVMPHCSVGLEVRGRG